MLHALATLLSDGPGQPSELGRIHWRRGLEAATAEAEATDRPVLLLFDEVPG